MSVAMMIALVLAVGVGLSLGAVGGGGAVLTLPILVYVAGFDVQESVAISMVVVGGTSLVAAVAAYRRGYFHAKAAALFALTGMVTAYGGSSLTTAVSGRTLMLAFAVLMVGAGTAMLRQRPERHEGAQCRTWPCLGIGATVGFLTGFLGVGGGFLIVPALVLFAGIETRIAIGTSLAVIAFNALAGLAGQIRHTSFDWPVALAFLGFALAGMVAGLRVAQRVSGTALRRAFALLILVLAVSIGVLTGLGGRLP